MKINLHIDEAYEQVEVDIFAPEYTKDVERLMQLLKQPHQAAMVGYIQQDIHVVKLDDIYAVVSEGGKIYLQTEEFEYETKQKLYEIEEQYSKTFARINKSTLINLQKLQSIHNKFGMAEVFLDNEISFPISRKYLKELKRKLGIGREAK